MSFIVGQRLRVRLSEGKNSRTHFFAIPAQNRLNFATRVAVANEVMRVVYVGQRLRVRLSEGKYSRTHFFAICTESSEYWQASRT